MPRRLIALPATLLGLLLAVAPTAAAPFPSVIPLPPGHAPEGIATGPGTTVYSGALSNGAIVAANVRTGEVTPLVPPAAGRVIAGIDYERGARRIWAAGGPTGQIHVFDARTGALLRTWQVATDTTFVNDLVVRDDAVYATDSQRAQLWVLPLPDDGSLPAPDAFEALPLGGDWEQVAGFNANGITARGPWLLVVNSTLGVVFRVDPSTGTALAVDLGGQSVTNGDGIELRGSRLYVVRNQRNEVPVFRLSGDLLSGTLLRTITDEDFVVPTTAAFAAGRLWLVNAKFGVPDVTGFEIVGVRP